MACGKYHYNISKLLLAHGCLSISIEREIEVARRSVEVYEVATLIHQPTLLSLNNEVGDVMNAHEYLNCEMEFDLNNPYEYR